jgi:hypothetical protein
MCNRMLQYNMHRWEDIIKMVLKEIDNDVMIWVKISYNKIQWRVFVNLNNIFGIFIVRVCLKYLSDC